MSDPSFFFEPADGSLLLEAPDRLEVATGPMSVVTEVVDIPAVLRAARLPRARAAERVPVSAMAHVCIEPGPALPRPRISRSTYAVAVMTSLLAVVTVVLAVASILTFGVAAGMLQ